ncbi:GNAT family N-acetyltransferase [Niallia circulans]|uniref:GNAT family N-acetyltransferase n=1 Tax=Niallia circulans TaxID=1397 RepID=A0A553SME7_NIACI|nr:GNAT family N-acetyltransferase [Niallia circulans]TRZ38148.1 GNAT family N-acetyltransferase [Niallia circulans]
MKYQQITVIPFQTEHISNINKTNERFPIIGRLVPSLLNGVWSFQEELYEQIRYTTFPDDTLPWHEYIEKEDKAIFLAFLNGEYVGQIRLIKDWNKFCYIENIAVCEKFRQNGVGNILFTKAEEWALSGGLGGISLEAQDDNLLACRFYLKQGMELGGVDSLKHAFNPNIDKTLYWYKVF